MKRAAIVVAIAALAAGAMRAEAAPGDAEPVAADLASPPSGRAALAKKDLAARAKTRTHGEPPAPGTRPAKLVNLYYAWTKEWLPIAVGAPGKPAPAPPATTLDRFLRDHFTNKPTRMEPRLLAFVLQAADHFHSDVVQIVSGFRHPKYNLILRKKGHQVARDSQHTHGTAVDFYLPRVPARTLEAWARAQKHGGVGFYPDSGFVHMDTGPVRTWSGE